MNENINITDQIKDDKEIDHDKIKKALRYNDDQRFLDNYDWIKNSNPQLVTKKDRDAFEKRQK